MLDPKKIPLARVKDAFCLRVNETERLIEELWPQNVFPWEIWRRAYDKYWRGVAASNADMFKLNNPPYPEMTGIWADADANAWCEKMYVFFSELAFALPASSLQKGLDYLLEETYEDSSNIFFAEREALFTSLREAEKDFNWRCFYPIDAEKLDIMLNDKAFGKPKNSYYFISKIFPDTMVVDKLAAVRYLLICGYPFDHEVKGLTRDYVERVKAALAVEFPVVLSPAVVRQYDTPMPLVEDTPSHAPDKPHTEKLEDTDNVITVSAALWEGKSPAAVRDAMQDEFAVSIIAYVLFYWCKVDKTQVGKLLATKEYNDPKSCRNVANKLLEKAATMTIVKG